MDEGMRQRREEVIKALAEFHESREGLAEMVSVNVTIDALFFGRMHAEHTNNITIVPDEDTDLGDIGKTALDGAKMVIRDVIMDIKQQWEDLEEEENERED